MVECDVMRILQAVGASIRIFELMDRESGVKDGDLIPENFDKGNFCVYIHSSWCVCVCRYNVSRCVVQLSIPT